MTSTEIWFVQFVREWCDHHRETAPVERILLDWCEEWQRTNLRVDEFLVEKFGE